jgi:hypothetical protein
MSFTRIPFAQNKKEPRITNDGMVNDVGSMGGLDMVIVFAHSGAHGDAGTKKDPHRWYPKRVG